MKRPAILKILAGFITVLSVAAVATQFLVPSEEDGLYRRALERPVPLETFASTEWDQVCVVGPYCGGFVTGSFCDRFDEDTWGLVFFKGGQATAIKTFSREIGFDGPLGPPSCRSPAEQPAFSAAGPRTLTVRPAKP